MNKLSVFLLMFSLGINVQAGVSTPSVDPVDPGVEVMEQPSSEPKAWYFQLDARPTFVESLEIDSIKRGLATGPGEIDFDPGVAMGFTLGANPLKYLAVELQLSGSYNDIDGLGDGYLVQAPITGNLRFEYPFTIFDQHEIVPFAGGGFGGTFITLQDIFFVNDQGGEVDGDGYKVVPLWQVTAGVTYRFSERWYAKVAYLYQETFDLDVLWGGLGAQSSRLEVGELGTHSVNVSFGFNF
ncbi:MAG: outer membrane beta-barrel protein [Verrucomicrobiota bacterium]